MALSVIMRAMSQIIADGLLCECGQSGCLEAISSEAVIARYVREQIVAGQKTPLHASRHTDLVTTQIAGATLKGDTLTTSAVEYVGDDAGLSGELAQARVIAK